MGTYDGLNFNANPYRVDPRMTEVRTNQPLTLKDILANFQGVHEQTQGRQNEADWQGFEGDISTEEGARQAAGIMVKQGNIEGAHRIMQDWQQKAQPADAGEWRAAGDGRIYNSKSGEYREYKPETPPAGATPSAPMPDPKVTQREKFEDQKRRAEAAFNEKKRVNDAKIARMKPVPSEDQAKFNSLPKDKQIQVQEFTKSKVGYTKSANNLRRVLERGKALKTDKEKAGYYLLALKRINSPENPDAVGAEEVQRLAPELRFQWGNFTNPSAEFIGTNIPGFEAKLAAFVSDLEGGAKDNDREIDKAYGRGAAQDTSGWTDVGGGIRVRKKS